jgi:hypothetical protein
VRVAPGVVGLLGVADAGGDVNAALAAVVVGRDRPRDRLAARVDRRVLGGDEALEDGLDVAAATTRSRCQRYLSPWPSTSSSPTLLGPCSDASRAAPGRARGGDLEGCSSTTSSSGLTDLEAAAARLADHHRLRRALGGRHDAAGTLNWIKIRSTTPTSS